MAPPKKYATKEEARSAQRARQQRWVEANPEKRRAVEAAYRQRNLALCNERSSWLESLRKAWRGKELAIGGQSVTALREAAGLKDRARHRVSWGGEKAAFELHVDWQRHYDPPSPLSVGDVKARLDEWSALASGYFEHFGVDFDG